jgi:hypothetical protein
MAIHLKYQEGRMRLLWRVSPPCLKTGALTRRLVDRVKEISLCLHYMLRAFTASWQA